MGMKRGKDLLETIRGHDSKRKCPGCSKDVSRSALVDLIYTHEPCDCAAATYTHLVETLYHRECFLRAGLGKPADEVKP